MKVKGKILTNMQKHYINIGKYQKQICHILMQKTNLGNIFSSASNSAIRFMLYYLGTTTLGEREISLNSKLGCRRAGDLNFAFS